MVFAAISMLISYVNITYKLMKSVGAHSETPRRM